MTSEFIKNCRNIYAVGRNYRAHAVELANPVPDTAIFFGKSPACLCEGPAVKLPTSLGAIHHELEVVLRLGTQVPVGGFLDLACISHLALGLDFTARALQATLKSEGLPWFRAKNFHHAAYLTDWRDFSGSWSPLKFQLFKNDELVQDGDTRDMIFRPQALLSDLNRTLAFEEGDLIFTGTPSGVAPVWHGDRLRLFSVDLALDQALTVHMD